jgi:glycyl-tRNA synthetase
MELMEKIVSLCKRRGFIYPGSAIYGGLANTWDFGPLGTELKNNIRDLWWQRFVKSRNDIYGLDGGIIMHPRVWEASGHLANFTDTLVECKKCHKRFREDQLTAKRCLECGGEFTSGKKFNGMFKTFVGPAESSESVAYLRPETAQAIFVNFKNIVDSFHPKLPFGIAQYGKSFRNEVTAGNFIFRDLEFEQMEIEYFIDPAANWSAAFDIWQKEMEEWLKDLGVAASRLHIREHRDDERSHYSRKTVDIEYDFPFGTKELYGLAYRTDYDLNQHQSFSGQDLGYTKEDGSRVVPHVIEPSFGMPRTLLAVLLESYHEEEVKPEDIRIVLKIKPRLAPYKVAVFPLLKNKPELVSKAQEIYAGLKKELMVTYDDNGNVGKRYRRQDEIGTPWCVTVDYTSLEDGTVTVRDRDSMKQERVLSQDLTNYFKEKLVR